MLYFHLRGLLMTLSDAENVIEIRVDEIAQLFDTLDPYPFREKDLDHEAEEYIVGWARELPSDRPFRIVIHVPDNSSAERLRQRSIGIRDRVLISC